MRILIVGPGAMGSLFAVLLADAGNDVFMLDYKPDRAARLNENGFRVHGISGERFKKIGVSLRADEIPKVDYTFIWVKSYDTASAVRSIGSALKGSGYVVTLQNGLGNADIIAERLGAEKVIAGVTSHGATCLAPGDILHAGAGETVIGTLSGRVSEGVTECARMLNDAGIQTRISEDIRSEIWGKLIVNAAINPLTAVTGLKNGELIQHDETIKIMRMAVEEGVKVAAELNVVLPYSDPMGRVVDVCRLTADNISSMLQDVMVGRKTEIDFINGAIARLGREKNIPTPVNETLVYLVKVREKGAR
ncbi:TPA: 2-dehydropantoate 2-reductase [Candidatus Poribacteria bacterium]|nr:2-dehydropantoate 2-reductase [Candidatus Poribacteria bacterium]HEX30499.1 2-dehydropantoate 2-reductase [Candidatus Poribacteria bacterium]